MSPLTEADTRAKYIDPKLKVAGSGGTVIAAESWNTWSTLPGWSFRSFWAAHGTRRLKTDVLLNV